MMMDERFKDKFEMSHFILFMMSKMPVGSIWLISDYLDDLFIHYKDFNKVKDFLSDNEKVDFSTSQVVVNVSSEFIEWFRIFINDNYRFSGYLGTHSLIFDRKVFFFQVESENLCFDKEWITNLVGLDKIPKQDYSFSLCDEINIDEIW